MYIQTKILTRQIICVSINFAFTLMPDEVRNEELILNRNEALEALKRMFPQNTYLDAEQGQTKTGGLIPWFDYYGPTLDIDMYALHAFMRIKRRLLYCLFNCPVDKHEGWKPIALEALSSICADKN